jgi:hypothetical protein
MKSIIAITLASIASVLVVIKLMVPVLARRFGASGIELWVPVWLARRLPFSVTLLLSYGLGPVLLTAIWLAVWYALSR